MNCPIDSSVRACSSGSSAGRTNASDHSRNLSRSAAGTPSSSAITVIGSGKANVETSSISPSATTGSRSVSAISWIRGRRRSIIRGVNAFDTSRRSRRWSSPSRLSMWLSTHSSASGNSAMKAASRSRWSANRGSRTKRLSSRSTASASAKRVTNQIGVSPSRPGWEKTGSFSRIRAKVAYASAKKSSL